MERQRKYKMFSIIALMFAVVGLSVGFAAFSKVLTINSSATVTPNEEDFKIVTYGFKDEDSLFYFDGYREFEDEHLSSEIGFGYSGDSVENEIEGTKATITNTTKSSIISNINVTFTKNGSYVYYFIIKNEGKYNAYFNLEQFENYDPNILKTGTCTSTENIDQEELEEVCSKTDIMILLSDSTGMYILGTEEEPYYKLSVGDYILVEMYISAGEGAIILEPYTVDFEDITFEFSTSP